MSLALFVGLSLTGCPDPDGAFDDFLSRRDAGALAPDTGPAGGGGGGGGGETGGAGGAGGGTGGAGGEALACEAPWDVTGQYLFSLSTFIRPDRPMVFWATVHFTPADRPTAANAGSATLDLQPLYCKGGASDPVCTREVVGDPIPRSEFTVDAQGAFTADLGSVLVVGDANPISGRDISANLVLKGSLRDRELCGGIAGEVTSPIQAELTTDRSRFGTTWVGAIDAPDTEVEAALKTAEIRFDCGPCLH